MKLTIITKIRDTRTYSSSPRAASVHKYPGVAWMTYRPTTRRSEHGRRAVVLSSPWHKQVTSFINELRGLVVPRGGLGFASWDTNPTLFGTTSTCFADPGMYPIMSLCVRRGKTNWGPVIRLELYGTVYWGLRTTSRQISFEFLFIKTRPLQILHNGFRRAIEWQNWILYVIFVGGEFW